MPVDDPPAELVIVLLEPAAKSGCEISCDGSCEVLLDVCVSL